MLSMCCLRRYLPVAPPLFLVVSAKTGIAHQKVEKKSQQRSQGLLWPLLLHHTLS